MSPTNDEEEQGGRDLEESQHVGNAVRLERSWSDGFVCCKSDEGSGREEGGRYLGQESDHLCPEGLQSQDTSPRPPDTSG